MKNKKRKFSFRLLIAAIALGAMLCPAAVKVNAQSANLNFDLKGQFIPNSNENYTSDTAKLVLTLQDTVNILKVHVKATRQDNSQVVLQHAFAFDSNTGLPAGTKWRRKGFVITVTLGKLTARQYDLEIKLEDKNHNFSPVKYFFR